MNFCHVSTCGRSESAEQCRILGIINSLDMQVKLVGIMSARSFAQSRPASVALGTSMLWPQFNPDFPGRRKGLYVFICVLFFIGMMAAVIIFGKEAKAPEHHPAEAAALISLL